MYFPKKYSDKKSYLQYIFCILYLINVKRDQKNINIILKIFGDQTLFVKSCSYRDIKKKRNHVCFNN